MFGSDRIPREGQRRGRGARRDNDGEGDHGYDMYLDEHGVSTAGAGRLKTA